MTGIARAALLVLIAALAACGSAGPTTTERSSGAWQRLPPPPLTPRDSAVALSIGREALFVGGSDAEPCPPNASCPAPADPPMRDGAAFDPGRRRWRRIADAPVGFSFAYVAVVHSTAYLLVPGEPGRPGAPPALLRYWSAGDRWARLAAPPDPRRRALVAAGGRVVAYAESDEGGEVPDVMLDRAAGKWRALPDDPLPPSFGRTMAWSGHELVLFAQRLVAQPGSREPSLLIAAAFDPDRGTWRRLPDSAILGAGARWFAHDRRLILPALGSADGGERAWGRPYPNGGVLDVGRGRWLALPDPPRGEAAVSAGVVAGRRADFSGVGGWVLDAVAGRWVPVPALDVGTVTGRAVAAAGRDMVVFGGVRWTRGPRGQLLDEAWRWSVP